MIDLNIVKTDEKPLLDQIRERIEVETETTKRIVVEDLLQLDGGYFALTWTERDGGEAEFRLWAGCVADHDAWFSLRLISETEGPERVDCPPWLIDLAPEHDHKAAAAWRRMCLRVAASKSRGLCYGAVIVFDDPICFDDGHKANAFRYMPGRCKENGRVFKSVKNQQFYAIPHFFDRAFAVAS